MFKKKQGPVDVFDLQEKLKDCPDIIQRQVYIDGQIEAYFIYISDMANMDLMQRDFIGPIMSMSLEELSDNKKASNIRCGETSFAYDVQETLDQILGGSTAFVCDSLPYAIICSSTDIAKRNIEEPVTEKNIRGPHEGFIEVLSTNLAIMRRKIRNSNLKFKEVALGDVSKQKVTLVYIEGIANQELVDGLFEKVSAIKTDALPAIGYIEQAVTSHPHSIFPQFLSTERPDKVSAALLEGRIAIFQEGTPVVLIAPVTFISFFQALDDYSTLWLHGTFLRLIRIFGAIVIAVFLPAFYIAITTFHYYAVPLTLLVTLAESRSKVPFPPIIEVLILEITVELLREASVRLPTYIGTAISVVAGLIIGQAAVEAGIVSGLVIVIAGATAVASYTIPSTDMSLAIRMLRFFFIIGAAIFGILGIVICTSITVANLMTLDSLGQPYFAPFSPLSTNELKDSFIRLPLKKMKKRPSTNRPKNKMRGKENEQG